MAFNVFEILESEHRLIAKALAGSRPCVPHLAQLGAAVQPVSPELIGFCEQFVSRYHQLKEHHLFLCLQRKGGASVSAPMVALLVDHCRLARLTGLMDGLGRMHPDGQPGNRALMAGYLADYITLTQEHMLKEDRFIRMACGLVDSLDQAALAVTFEQLEQEPSGVARRAHCVQWAGTCLSGDTLCVRSADSSLVNGSAVGSTQEQCFC